MFEEAPTDPGRLTIFHDLNRPFEQDWRVRCVSLLFDRGALALWPSIESTDDSTGTSPLVPGGGGRELDRMPSPIPSFRSVSRSPSPPPRPPGEDKNAARSKSPPEPPPELALSPVRSPTPATSAAAATPLARHSHPLSSSGTASNGTGNAFSRFISKAKIEFKSPAFDFGRKGHVQHDDKRRPRVSLTGTLGAIE